MINRIMCLAVMFTSLNAFSWFDVGHEVVGEIAWLNLDEGTRLKVNSLLKELTPIYEGASSLAAVGKLPDHMRTGFKIFDAWHYIDLPFVSIAAQPEAAKSPNIVWALCECVRSLSAKDTNKKSDNPFAFSPKPFERAFMLPFLVHLVGDIHQPLHAISRYSPMLPSGDSGGNFFPIRVGDKVTNLHFYWDSGLGVFSDVGEKYVALTGKDPKTEALAQSVMKEFPRKHFGNQIEQTVFRAWANDSHELAKTVVYDLIEGLQPSDSYVKKGQKLSKERVALAGYRLAFVLSSMLSENGSLVTGCNL